VTLNIHVSNYTTITRTTHILGLHPWNIIVVVDRHLINLHLH
jgi:hypothetical protein